MARNPNWTKDESILALDLYSRVGYRVLSGNHPEVVALSELMNSLPIHPQELRDSKFRNPSGINTKLANFRHLDPDRPGGLSGAPQIDRAVWSEFAGDIPRLRRVVELIRVSAPRPEVEAETELPDESAPEGRVLLRVHKIRERNRYLVEAKKRRAKKELGRLLCEACGFDFVAVYGELGEDFIERHHTVPVADLAPDEKTHMSDLALLCANCHRMVHRSGEVLSIEVLRERIRTTKASCKGIKLPKRCTLPDGAVPLPSATADPGIWAVAHQLSKLLELEHPTDEPPFPTRQNELSDVTVWLWVESCFAVGFLCTRPVQHFRWLDEVEAGNVNNIATCRDCHAINSVWVAKCRRKDKIALRLAEAAAAHYGIPVSDFVHSPPFSCKGRQFAERLSGGRVRI